MTLTMFVCLILNKKKLTLTLFDTDTDTYTEIGRMFYTYIGIVCLCDTDIDYNTEIVFSLDRTLASVNSRHSHANLDRHRHPP